MCFCTALQGDCTPLWCVYSPEREFHSFSWRPFQKPSIKLELHFEREILSCGFCGKTHNVLTHWIMQAKQVYPLRLIIIIMISPAATGGARQSISGGITVILRDSFDTSSWHAPSIPDQYLIKLNRLLGVYKHRQPQREQTWGQLGKTK